MRATFEVGQRITHTDAFQAWLREHHIGPNITFKVEIEGDTITAHQFVRGQKGIVHHDGEPETRTLTARLKSPPPTMRGEATR